MFTGKYSSLLRNWLVAFFDPRRLYGLGQLPQYLKERSRYRSLPSAEKLCWSESYPCLADRVAHTPIDFHYFYQAAWAARKLAVLKPTYHVDIGSSVSMIAVISAWLPTTFVDIRPLQVQLPNLQRCSGDVLALPFKDNSIYSLSCLHVIEHVGLGRYGDSLNPQGSRQSARELARVLAPGGTLLLSVPVGRERVQFNAHRVFAPSTVLSMFKPLELSEFCAVNDKGLFLYPGDSKEVANCHLALGMFEFTKLNMRSARSES